MMQNMHKNIARIVAACALTVLWHADLVAVELQAEVQWARRVELGTPVSGVVEEVAVSTGDIVDQGAVMLRLEPGRYQARVAKAQAEVDKQTELRAEAKREWDRARELYDRTVLADRDLKLAEIAYRAADADYRSAQAALSQAQIDLRHSSVRAPFRGVVVQREVEVGQTVVSELRADPLLVLAEIGQYRARALLPGPRLEDVALGQTVSVAVAGSRYDGVVRSIGLEPVATESGAAAYPIDVIFTTAPSLVLRAGSGASITLP